MLNTVILHGRFVDAPELKTTQSGKSVTSFTLAVPRDYKKDGQEITDFLTCVAWGATAEFAAKYFGKGAAAIVRGSIETRKYEDKNGNKRTATEIKVDNLYFGESKKKDTDSNDAPEAFRDIPDIEVDDDDLPF